MDLKTYQAEALKTAPSFEKPQLSHGDYVKYPVQLDDKQAYLLNALVGIVGEAGELLDSHKKVVFQGHPFNREKLIDELGDVLWYANLLCYAIDSSFEEVFESNIAKLRKRYGESFDSIKSINRTE